MDRSRIETLRKLVELNTLMPNSIMDNAMCLFAIAKNKPLPLAVIKSGVNGDTDDAEMMAELVALSHYACYPDSHNGKRKVWVHKWSRDCDGSEGDSIRLIDATQSAWDDYQNSAYSNAEGPVRLTFISESEAAEFQASFRDTYAEAMGY